VYALTEESVKARLRERGVQVPAGTVVASAVEARAAASTLAGPAMVKALVAATDRARKGLVVRAADAAAAEVAAARMLGSTVDGQRVERLLVEALAGEGEEHYLAAGVDHVHGVPVLLHGPGGSGVEQRTPPRRISFRLDYAAGVAADLPGPLRPVADALVAEFAALGALLVELNPVRVVAGEAVVLDGKATLDRTAPLPADAYRTGGQDVDEAAARLHRRAEELKGGTEVRFGRLDGDVGLVSAGGGVLNVVHDALRRQGLAPANFADVSGGSATTQLLGAVAEEVVALRPAAVLVVTGITSSVSVTGFAAEMARALAPLAERERPVPVVARLAGAGEEEAVEIMAGLPQCRVVGRDTTVDEAVALLARDLDALPRPVDAGR
jgi:succinyl-CoA synthetase beta subunit